MLKKNIQQVKLYLQELQQQICCFLEQEESSATFIDDAWQHPSGGGGLSKILSDGAVIEKAGVNFSHVKGAKLPPSATLLRPEWIDCPFEALGVSVVVHPLNPYVPTVHANVRYIEVTQSNTSIGWFGGGFDLTPYYGFEEDCVHWHQTAKKACDPFGLETYLRYKKQCDEYFYLKHRHEPRGIGGIFFDDLQEDFSRSFELMQSVGTHFIKAYQPILSKRKQLPYTNKERAFQAYRRGRYVEFNLLYDRGTLFGLQSGGRTESILMSLPPTVCWKYNWLPEKDSPEEELLKKFLVIRSWI